MDRKGPLDFGISNTVLVESQESEKSRIVIKSILK
jgi:hypothetical protein